ncbi:restriction endonuclease subunit S, partial [uncultured Brachyspira sp.]
MIYENNKKLIPKLRFPEFQTSGEWKTVRLGDLIKEKNIRNKNNLITLVLSVTNKKDGFVIQNEFFGKSIASKNVSNYKIVNKWDFAYNPARINIGSISMLENFEVCIVSPMYVVFSINHEIIYKYFLKYWIQSYNFTGYIKPLLAGSVRNILSFNSMQEMIIQIPSLEEQHRIASFLTSADELIDAERRKLEALKKYKKGLMQKLFPRDGEKIPEMRFPKFKNNSNINFLNGNVLFENISDKNHNSDLPILAITQDKGAIP